jgi:hypothetical protein
MKILQTLFYLLCLFNTLYTRAILPEDLLYYTGEWSQSFISPVILHMLATTSPPSIHSLAYSDKYALIKQDWKAAALGVENLFFEGDAINSELTDTAILALMYRFLIDNPEVKIPDLDNFKVFTIANYTPATYTAIVEPKTIQNSLLIPALTAFRDGKNLYATIVQVGGAGSGHYTVVVIEKTGKVHMINTFKPYEGEAAKEPYQYILTALVNSLNVQKGAEDINFMVESNIRTGIQDPDIGSNSCGIYSFVYWAALMMTQTMDAYQRITAAASDGKLTIYGDIKAASSYSRTEPQVVQILDRTDGFGVQYFKNPHAEEQARFEQNLRAWLQAELAALSSS